MRSENSGANLLRPGISGSQNLIILVFGKKGRGKTRLVQTYLLPQLRKRRLVIFDPHAEYNQPWITRADSIEDLQDFLADYNDESPFAVCWTPGHADEVPNFPALVYQMENLWVIVEEVNMRGMGNLWTPAPEFLDLVNFGRNKGISLIGTAKRPAHVIRDLTSQADIIISFKQDEPNDIKYLREMCGPDVEPVVRNLGQHDWEIVYTAWERGRLENKQKIS